MSVLIQGHIPISIYSENLQVNKLARRLRHRRNFKGLTSVALKLSKVITLPTFKAKAKTAKNKVISDTQIIKRAIGFVAFFVIVTSFTPNIAFSDADYTYAQMSAGPIISSNIIADDAGFIIPVNPQTGEADRSDMSDKIAHKVESGETLSTIAAMYDLKTKTLMWENNMGTGSVLRVGSELIVPPVNGVTHTVKSGQSLAKVATLYDVEEAAIVKQNNIEGETIKAGQKIFVPGGTMIAPPAPIIASSGSRSTVRATSVTTRVPMSNSTTAPAVGKFIIYPTRGKITQGYHSWHRAVDIADVSKPPIWAAAAGTVTKASSGTWGGGYGNHIIIDHGNGTQTLYAHMDYLTVSNGQYVTQGEVIGRMGNTGRVYGRTGIHLHFEVRSGGIKVYPGNYW